MCTDGKQCIKVIPSNYTKASQALSILAIVLLGICIIILPLWKFFSSSTYFDVYPFLLLFAFSFAACTAIFYTVEQGSQRLSWAYVLQWVGIVMVTVAVVFAFMRFTHNKPKEELNIRGQPVGITGDYNPDDGRTLY